MPVQGCRQQLQESLEARDGDVVILAVPYHAVSDIIATYGDQLRGKVVVDISNPVNFETFDSLVVPVGSSAATEIAAKLPDSTVLKAFNTTLASTLASKNEVLPRRCPRSSGGAAVRTP